MLLFGWIRNFFFHLNLTQITYSLGVIDLYCKCGGNIRSEKKVEITAKLSYRLHIL